MLKRFSISFLAGFLFFTSITTALAQPTEVFESVWGSGPWYNQSFGQFYSKVYDKDTPATEIFGERYTAAQVDWIIWTILSWPTTKVLGPNLISCWATFDLAKCGTSLTDLISSSPTQDSIAYKEKQPILEEIVQTIFWEDRPISGITYIKDFFRKFHIIPEAKAQSPGFGFQALEPIRGLWVATRNLTYGLFIFITVVLAFMIMFRVKLSPQTAITIQSALPKIFIALILATFSYAIAGFLVDLMYVFIGLIAIVLESTFNISGVSEGAESFFQLIFGVLAGPIGNLAGILVDKTNILNQNAFGLLTKGPLGTGILGAFIIYTFLFFLTFFIAFFFSVGGLMATILSALTLGIFPTLIGLLGLIISFILFILLLFVFFRVIFMLIKTFTSLLLLTIIAPLQIAIGALFPSLGFGAWLKNYVANLAVFPLTGLLIMLAFIFLNLSASLAFKSAIPNFVATVSDSVLGTSLANTGAYGRGWPPFLGVSEGAISILFLFVSVTILFMLPKAADIIKAMIEGRPFAYGTAIGEALGPARTTGGLVGAGAVLRGAEEIEDATRFAAWQKKLAKSVGGEVSKWMGRGFR